MRVALLRREDALGPLDAGMRMGAQPAQLEDDFLWHLFCQEGAAFLDSVSIGALSLRTDEEV